MQFTSSFVALVAAALVSAAPARFYGKRAPGATDILVYKFADVLEQLESTFYSQALSKFQDSDFQAAGFTASQIAIEQFKVIQSDEATHSTVLQAALKSFGETPITSCKFNFDSALTDVATMAATARVVEAVGVGAYLGGATLMTDPVLLDSAASILTVEARHQTILNLLSGTGTAVPAAFDISLTPSEVLALAGPFFDGACDLGIPANPALSLTNTGVVAPGTKLSFSTPAITSANDTSKLFCQMMLGGQPFSIPLPFDNCVVPDGVNGPVGIWITSDGQPLTNNVRDRATTQLVAGPTMAFIDTQPQMLSQLTRGSASGSSGSSSSDSAGAPAASSVSTATISPAEASSIIASASATASAAGPNATASESTPQTDASVSTPATPGSPNTATGPSSDGSINVVGWSNI
ncbi:hypothetical protein JR316_0005201 [Psilocybe cubensis]|uniref:Uncharacterized protein n=2 Tax=Psilocybe cubensis TaxID=181762 RepID=A0ACB8H527_PSICU|nr:hypothetical protein JR316_0005201 [Psilocybe cubensis]KAH9483100.1 hypothetical protein JR316_0005201 [Psilocybe cubensis]